MLPAEMPPLPTHYDSNGSTKLLLELELAAPLVPAELWPPLPLPLPPLLPQLLPPPKAQVVAKIALAEARTSVVVKSLEEKGTLAVVAIGE